MSSYDVAKIRAEVEAAIQAACASVLCNSNSREQVEEHIGRTLRETVPADLRQCLEWETYTPSEGVLAIRPTNLFTGLIISGVPAETARQYLGRDLAHLEQGCYFFTDGQFVFRPAQPIEQITVTLKLPEGSGL